MEIRLVAFLISIQLILNSEAAKILLIPFTHKSHVQYFAITARGLQAAGHTADVLVLESRRSIVERIGPNPLVYESAKYNELIEDPEKFEHLLLTNSRNIMKIVVDMTVATMEICEALFANEELMSRLERNDYDLVMIDGIDYGRCLYALPYRLGVKYITFAVKHDPWQAGLPAVPSVEHMPLIGNIITEDSTLGERLKSLFIYIFKYVTLPPAALDDSAIERYAPEKPKTTYAEIVRNSSMWLVKLETHCLDWPHVHNSHYKFVGGIGLEDAKPLPADLEQFVQQAAEGIIVLSFGTAIPIIPAEMLDKILDAFPRTKHHVIMRHTGEVHRKVPDNVLILPWLPQADILGHPKTKAFVTHGGANGQLEALHHAVPLITIPLFADQFYNGERAERKGLGVVLNKELFTVEELLDAIEKVTSPLYQDNMRKASDLFHSFPPAEETILFWVEHVLRFGGDHLRPVSIKVPIWQFLMLDILAILIFIVLFVYSCLLFLLLRMFRRRYGDVTSVKKVQ